MLNVVAVLTTRIFEEGEIKIEAIDTTALAVLPSESVTRTVAFPDDAGAVYTPVLELIEPVPEATE